VNVRVVNLGSCNGCELELLDLLHLEPGLRLCERDDEAEVVLVTGVLTEANRARAERVKLRPGVPVLRIGSCGISQGLFLPPDGALDRVPDLGRSAARVVVGCPPASSEIAAALRSLSGGCAE
jgi:Ni,Fe-hydrogenase III small subunit